MRFEYLCDCGYQNSFFIHAKKITDFYCDNCGDYIGSSNCQTIQFKQVIDFDKNHPKIVEDEPLWRFATIDLGEYADCHFGSTNDTSFTRYHPPIGTTARYW